MNSIGFNPKFTITNRITAGLTRIERARGFLEAAALSEAWVREMGRRALIVEGVVLETLLEKIFGVTGSGVAAVDGPSRFYVLWRYAYKAAEMGAGEAIVFTYGQNVEFDGQNGLSSGNRALVEKRNWLWNKNGLKGQ